LENVPKQLRDGPVENLSLINQVRSGVDTEGITDLPTFELKEKLVKLVGNLAFRNQKCQDLVSEQLKHVDYRLSS
jgi:hypothetical protein